MISRNEEQYLIQDTQATEKSIIQKPRGRKRRTMKTRVHKILSVFLALAILLSVVPVSPLAKAAVVTTGTTVDASSHHQWHENLEHSTKEIGRIWTDKTVWDADIAYPYHEQVGQLGVERGDSDLLIELSALSSAASITGKVIASVPLDIVMVLDTSGSMDDEMPTGTYSAIYGAMDYRTLYEAATGGSPYAYKIGDDYVEIYAASSGNGNNRRYSLYYTAPGATQRTYIVQNARSLDTEFDLAYALYEEGTGNQWEQVYGSVTYRELYNGADSDNPYYVQIGNEMVEIEASRGGSILNRTYSIYYTAPGQSTPTYIVRNTSNLDNSLSLEDSAYALYQKGITTRLAALQESVKDFIRETQETNATIATQADRHRISLVEFSSEGSSSTRKLIDLTYVDSTTNVNTLTNIVDDLYAEGATRADLGMGVAKDILTATTGRVPRENAQKVVIFFTDGTPTTSNTFSGTVANGAISHAKTLKDMETIIYTIGVYEEADPADTSKNFNQYMHGVSSNYPSATAYTALGTRAQSGNYYLSASDSASLNQIFGTIFEDVVRLTASASTRVEEGNEGESGYITFVDELGQYMKVDDFKAISFAGRNYVNPVVAPKTGNPNVTTYTFSGANSDNPLFPTTGNLNQIIIEVQKSDDVAQGDIVTVKIPGALIPVHHYDVAIDENGKITMVEDTTLPMRIWYGVSMKEEVEALMEKPDAAFAAYIAQNTDADGNVRFYSNRYQEGEMKVYSTFEPNQRNNFYYFQTDEYLFTDEACTQPATEMRADLTYYYQRIYYHPKENPTYEGEAEELINTTKIPGSSNLMLAGYAKVGVNGQLYIPKGAPRTTSITDYHVYKTELGGNVTGTSQYAIDPQWIDVMSNPTTVINELGNNGIVTAVLPGTLAVTKAVTADEGLTPPDKDFTFQIALSAPAGESLAQTYNAQIFDAAGAAVGTMFAFNPATGNTVTLKAGQTVYLYGLADGVTYTITETAIPNGFAQVGQATHTGAIAKGATSTVTVTNHYSAESISLTGAQLGLVGTKILSGREFRAGDRFEFKLAATVFSPNAPLPSGLTNGVVAVTPTSGTSAQFDIGTFTFDKPGEYHYELREVIPDAANKVLGVSYDATIYRISMVIADDGEGSLKLARLVIDKSSTSATGWDTLYSGVTLPAENSKYPQFTNTYSTQTETIILRGIKVLENKNLSDYGAGAFRFNIVAGGSRPIGSSDAFVADSNQPMPNSATASTASTGDIVFGGLVFDGSNPVVGKEFKYIITEVQPTENGLYSGTPIAGATKDLNGNWVYEGITYDKSEKEIFIQVTSTDNGAGEVIVPQVVGNQFVFTNSYHTNTVTYNIAGEKVMDGRDFQEGDSFTFEIEAVGGAPAPVNGQNQPVTSVTIQPTAGKNERFSFGTISFNQDNMRDGLTAGGSAKTKTFTYILREVKGNAAGITYDTAERTLTLELKDNLGSLEIVSAKLNGETLQDGEISWTNIYRASVAYSGVEIVKTLEGKALTKGEFSFKLTPEAGTPDIPATEKSFAISKNAYYNPESNSSTEKMQKLTGLVFTQADAGKTFSYVLEEVIPSETGRTTYDKSQYRLALTPYDNGDGTMGVKTVVTQIRNGAGETVSVVTEFDSTGAQIPSVKFNNKYDIQDGILEGAANLNVTKNLNGREWKDTDAFQFVLEMQGQVPAGAVVLPAQTEITIDRNTANYTKAFGDIRFTQTGTYTFTIKEVAPAGGEKDGVIYDSLVSTIVVDVTYSGSGQLEVIVNSSDTLTFVNHYEVSEGTSLTINGEKTLANKDLVDGAFTFELYEANENFEVSGEPETQVNEDGFFAFTLTYEPTDAGKTFYYVLREMNYGEIIDGVAYDATEYHITVTVEDDTLGGTNAVKTIVKGTEVVQNIKLENVYAVRTGTTTVIEGEKKLTGRDLVDDEFTFELYAANQEFVVSGEPATATNKSGEFSFTLNYEPADADKTFYYVLKEKNAGKKVDRVTYDDAQYLITVKVEDDGVGGLRIAEQKVTKLGSEEEVSKIVFQNTYTADPLSPPKTGDETPLFLWTALLFVSGIGFATTVVSFEKKKKEQTK